MRNSAKPLAKRTAGDLMSRPAVTVLEGMPLWEAARLLAQSRVHGAPVVDEAGRCVGVLTVSDLARWAVRRLTFTPPPSDSRPSAQFDRAPGGREALLSTFLFGVCVSQPPWGTEGGMAAAGTRPLGECEDWQASDTQGPVEVVRQYMTGGPVTATEGVPIRTLARQMTDAGIHRIIVIDRQRRPIGVVSSTDLLAALADSQELIPGRPREVNAKSN
jgi:CBS domain-containing protein